jgi:aspartyl-tRNA(Asn)/glutamyl-tRNA(Gln) amidotransferase subunit A
MTPAELDARLARIRAADPRLRAFIDLDEAGARADQAAGRTGPLAGLLIGIKGNIAVAGLANTAGSAARRRAIAAADAPVVTMLRAAGGIVAGTLNMHEGALGATTDNRAFGRCVNPWREGFSPGGSSGGSGAAVAAGLVDAALGSDTMGSIRLPSAYCGVFGWKPSGTLVPQAGVVPLSHTLDQTGPLAKDAPTLWAMARALGGPAPAPGLAGLRFGVPTGLATLAPGVAALFADTRTRLAGHGLELVDLDLDLGLTPTDVVLAALLVCEIEGATHWADALADPESGLSDEFRSMLNYGVRMGPTLEAGARAKLAQVRERMRGAIARQNLSGLILPTTSHVAFSHAEGPPLDQPYLTMHANIADLPALSAPMGLVEGLPAGIQIMAAPGREDLALGFAGLFEPMTPPGVDGLSAGS